MSTLKNVVIKTRYKIKHFIEATSYCELYSHPKPTNFDHQNQ